MHALHFIYKKRNSMFKIPEDNIDMHCLAATVAIRAIHFVIVLTWFSHYVFFFFGGANCFQM